jgi:hemoglobin
VPSPPPAPPADERPEPRPAEAPSGPAPGRRLAVRGVIKGEQPGALDPAQVASMYERVGGHAWFEALVDRFYDAVAVDPVLRPIYPDEDLTAARAHLCGFLVQYWGGPMTYSEERGHPRLRMRHARFAIGSAERDAWYGHMAAAVAAGGLSASDEAAFLAYFAMSADALVNQPG